MTSYANYKIWQDVYHVPCKNMILYVKFTKNIISEFTLLSFKEKYEDFFMENTMIHPETGKILRRDVRPIEYTYKGEKITINQPGWFPDGDDDGVLTSEDWKISDQALEILKARHAEKIQQNNSDFKNISFA